MKLPVFIFALLSCQPALAQIVFNNLDLKEPNRGPFERMDGVNSVRTFLSSGNAAWEEEEIPLSDRKLLEETYFDENGMIEVSFKYSSDNPKDYIETAYTRFGDTIRVEEKNRIGELLYHWLYVDSSVVDASEYDNGPLYTWDFKFENGAPVKVAAYSRTGVEIYREVTARDALNRAIYECRFDAGKLGRIKFMDYDLKENAKRVYTVDHNDISKAAKKLKKEPEEICGLSYEKVLGVLKEKVNHHFEFFGIHGIEKEVEYDRFYDMTFDTEYRYSEQGRLDTTIYKAQQAKVEYVYGEEVFTYDESGKLVQKDEFTFKDGKKFLKRYQYEYTSK